MRVWFAVFCWGLIFVVALIAGVMIFSSLLAGLAFWALAMTRLVTPFLVSVPEVTGLVTINLLAAIGGKTYYCYPTGMHFRFPWEQVKVGNFINIRTVTPDLIVESYPAKDGPAMLTKWSFQYIALVLYLDRYIAVDETTINRGIIEVGSGFLSAEIARTDAENVKTNQDQMGRDLQGEFERMDPPPEQRYGIKILVVALADIDFEPQYQRVRTSERVATKLREIADGLKRGNITEKDALNAAMVVNGDVAKRIQEVEGQGGEALAALLMAMSRGGKD